MPDRTVLSLVVEFSMVDDMMMNEYGQDNAVPLRRVEGRPYCDRWGVVILTLRTAGPTRRLVCTPAGRTVLSLTAEFLTVDDTMIDSTMISNDAVPLRRAT